VILAYPSLTPVGESDWMVTAPLVYASSLPEVNAAYAQGIITVPVGYVCDLASVPRVPGIHWRYGGRARIPALLHDWCYDCATVRLDRKTADQLFLEAMQQVGDPASPAARRVMYWAVRLGGWRGWRSRNRRDCPEVSK
jgi:hypothetical protein